MHNEDINKVSATIIGAAGKVHRELGPGLPGSAYEILLAHQLVESGLKVEKMKSLPVTYRNKSMDFGYRVGLLVENQVMVEFNRPGRLEQVQAGELVAYLKLFGFKSGFLIDFAARQMDEGIRRLAV